MRLLVALCVLALVAVAAAEKPKYTTVDESVLMPHPVDTVLDMEEDDDFHSVPSTTTTSKATTTTTTSTTTTTTTTTAKPTTTTTTTTTTTAAPTTTSEPTYSPSLTALLKVFNLSWRRLRRHGYTDSQVRELVRRMVERRAFEHAREVLSAAERRQRAAREAARAAARAARLRAKRRAARRARLLAQRRAREAARRRAAEARRRAERARKRAEEERRRKELEEMEAEKAARLNRLPASLRKALEKFGFNVNSIADANLPIDEVKRELQAAVKEQSARIRQQYDSQVKDIVSKFSSEYQDGLKKPLADVARVTAETAREAELARNKTEFAKRAAARLRDSVQRREARLRQQLLETEKRIEAEAKREELEAEKTTAQAVQKMRSAAAEDIQREENNANTELQKARRLGRAAMHWFQDQELPALRKFAQQEQEKMDNAVADARIKSRYEIMQLRQKLRT